MTAQIDGLDLAPSRTHSGLGPPDLNPPDLDPPALDPPALDVHDLTDPDLVVTARALALVDAVMQHEDTAPLEAAFAADDEDDEGLGSRAACPEAGFRAFMTHYQRRVRNLLRHYLRRPQDVDEATQDVFLKMWLCWDPAQTPQHRHALVFRVTRNTAYDKLKSRAFREYEKTVFSDDVDDSAATDGSPDHHVLRAERIAAVRAALIDLPEKQRELLVARWYQETSFADLAADQGTTPRALITQQTRIFNKLRLRLAQASVLPLTRPGLSQRLRTLLSSMPDAAHTAMIGVLVTSLAAAQPAAIVPDHVPARDAAGYAAEWQRPLPAFSFRATELAAAGDDTSGGAPDVVRPAAAVPPRTDRDQPPRTIPALPLPTPDVEVGPCDEGADGDQVTVEVKALDVRKCRKQNVVELCPVVPRGIPGVTCRTQGKPSYLVPLPAPGTETL